MYSAGNDLIDCVCVKFTCRLPIFAKHVGIPLSNLQYPSVIPPLVQISLLITLMLHYTLH